MYVLITKGCFPIIHILTFQIHCYIKKLGISKTVQNIYMEKNDLFSVVITFSLSTSKELIFLLFKKQLLHIFDRYEKRNSNLKLNDLFEYMGFPINWKEITKKISQNISGDISKNISTYI